MYAYGSSFHIFELACAAFASTITVGSFLRTLVCLLRKEQARRHIRSTCDLQLDFLAATARRRPLTRDEVALAKGRIMANFRNMTKAQIEVVEWGMTQPSPSGRRRFVEYLVMSGRR